MNNRNFRLGYRDIKRIQEQRERKNNKRLLLIICIFIGLFFICLIGQCNKSQARLERQVSMTAVSFAGASQSGNYQDFEGKK